jgi:hypothetical protein
MGSLTGLLQCFYIEQQFSGEWIQVTPSITLGAIELVLLPTDFISFNRFYGIHPWQCVGHDSFNRFYCIHPWQCVGHDSFNRFYCIHPWQRVGHHIDTAHDILYVQVVFLYREYPSGKPASRLGLSWLHEPDEGLVIGSNQSLPPQHVRSKQV